MDGQPTPSYFPLNAGVVRPPLSLAERGLVPSSIPGPTIEPRGAIPLSQTLTLAEQLASVLAGQVQRLEEAAAAMHGFELAPDGPASAFPTLATGDMLHWMLDTRMAVLLTRLERVTAFTDSVR